MVVLSVVVVAQVDLELELVWLSLLERVTPLLLVVVGQEGQATEALVEKVVQILLLQERQLRKAQVVQERTHLKHTVVVAAGHLVRH